MELLKHGFREEGFAKSHIFAKIVFGNSRVDFFVFVGGLGDSFSDFFCLGNRLGHLVVLKVTLGILIGT